MTSPSVPPDLPKLRINWDLPPASVKIAFSFRVTPGLLLAGMCFGVVMGLVGGFFPAWRAARMPVVQALR